ncbi:unnamed protein product, partial [Wuchereria bancrofti]
MDLSLIKQKLASSQSKGQKKTYEKIDYTKIFWKPKPGKYQIRILPSKFDKSNPFREVYLHYGFSKGPILSLENWNEKDPISEFSKNLHKSSDKEDWQLASKISPKLRYFVPVLVRGEEDKGARLWEFGKLIYEQLLGIASDEDYGDYTDVTDGRDFTVEAVEDTIAGRKGVKCNIRVKPKVSPISEDANLVKKVLEEQPDILGINKKYSFEELKDLLTKWLNPEEDNDEPIASASSEEEHGGDDFLEEIKKPVEKVIEKDKASSFKEQRWLPFSPTMRDALSIPGVPLGHVFVVRGGSDTGKTTLLIEVATTAQKMGILPVFIITEMKWDFAHAQKMGFQCKAIPDEGTGEIINYDGFFLYVDRGSLNTIEDVSGFIADTLNEQKEGKLPFDLLFLWDSVGSIPCEMSVTQGKNNPMWNAGAMATQFGNFINQQFPLSRKEKYPYTNTLFVINKTGVQPALTPMSQPRMTNKGGNSMYWDATIVTTFGNVTNSGTSKISVQHK